MTVSTPRLVAADRAPTIRPLTDGWTLRVAAATSTLPGVRVPADIRAAVVTATVPGSVHTDLLAAELIPDPYLDDNEALLSWIGLTDWRYETTFAWQPSGAERVELVFGGLDTIATLVVNGVTIGQTRNMHRSYRFDVTAVLRPGLNELGITFASAIRHADAASLELGYRPHVNHHPYNAIRKMACSFGWDWGIDTSSAGIWRPVTLESWSVARLAQVRSVATVSGSSGVVDVHIDLDRVVADGGADEPLTLTVTIGGEVSTAEVLAGVTSAVIPVTVENAALWWPRGYGEQPLYDVHTELVAGDRVLDTHDSRVGFRTVELDTTPDAAGTPFTIIINGQPIVIRGANWIPDDAFPHRVDRDRYARRIDQAEFANLNLIRVWGGGIYESDDFYELCDERGMLTWQDFLLACAAYAEEDPLFSEIEAEAREAVARIGTHPSLVLFNGNNENLWGYEEWNWKLRLEGRTWGAGYYYDLFPSIVAELAPHVGYTPGSPFSPGAADRHPNDPEHGSMHIWDLWNQRDYPEYRSYSPRFVAEFGWQGPPTWSTMRASISDEPLTPESPGMLVHQKAMEGNVKLTDGLVRHLPLPNEIGDWHWAMSLNQATAISTAIEHFRSLEPHCMGNIVWQLNDCWPVTSWAAVDGNGRAKPLLFALRHANADRLITIQPRGDALVAVVVNDSGDDWAGEFTARRLDFGAAVLAEHSETVDVPARSSVTIELPASVSAATDAGAELIRASIDDLHGDWFFAEYRDSALGTAALSVVAEANTAGYTVRVTARTLVRDLTLLVDRIDQDATISDALVTLLPGETAEFTVTTAVEVDPALFESREVLRSANQLVKP